MTTEPIIKESEMEFIVDPRENFFHIEKSKTYEKINEELNKKLKLGLKIAEFILLPTFSRFFRHLDIYETIAP